MSRTIRKLSVFVMIAAAISLSACEANTTNQTEADSSVEPAGHITSVTAITEVFGDGQKVSAVALEYDAAIDTSKLATSDFSVEGQTVTKVYANTAAEKAVQGANGQYVIVELSTEMASDTAQGNPGGEGMQGDGGMQGGNGQDGDTGDNTGDTPPTDGNGSQGSPEGNSQSPGSGGPQLGSEATDSSEIPVLTASVTQTADIVTADGQTYQADSNAMSSSRTLNLVVDDFQQLTYTDPNYDNKQLMYNLYVPENYDSSKKYPLVVFMHDAGVVSNNPIETLTQGLGAVIWATAEEQVKHESFVLAPQYTSTIADDNSETTDMMDITIDLIQELESQYSIDPNRIYNTGQSMGGMTSIAMDIKYPDLFAASLLVACQWDPAKVTPMAEDNLWIVVSEGDNKANPGMDAITEVLKAQGATVSKATFSAEASEEEISKHIEEMTAQGTNINYTVYEGGGHTYTWQYAYTMEGVRDWLFEQVKK